jgi:hypothetical protein
MPILRLVIITTIMQCILNYGSLAQEQRELTDTEILAAYCYGVATEQYRKKYSEINQRPSGGPVREYVLPSVIAAIYERQDRLRDYLNIKRLLTDPKIRIPLQRGNNDAAQCQSEINSRFYQRCREERDPQCGSPESCTRVKRCLENFLPF